MKIGEAASTSGCHIETIRYDEPVGVLPCAQRTSSGYRSYTTAEVARLRFISRGRRPGFSLDEIRALLALGEDVSLSCQLRTRARPLERQGTFDATTGKRQAAARCGQSNGT